MPDRDGRNRNRPVVLRASFGVWVFAVATLLVVYLVIDAVVGGAVLFALASLPWLALVLWVIYVVTVRPCVIVSKDELVIVNVGRVHHLPWGAIADLTSRYQLSVILNSGRRIVSWGAPSLGVDRVSVWGVGRSQPQPRAQGVRGGPRPQVPVTSLIDNARARWEGDDGGSIPTGTPRSGWDVPVVIGTGVIAAFCAISVLLVNGAA